MSFRAAVTPTDEAGPFGQCARCGGKAECQIWEHPSCYPCAADWHASAPEKPSAPECRAHTKEWVEQLSPSGEPLRKRGGR